MESGIGSVIFFFLDQVIRGFLLDVPCLACLVDLDVLLLVRLENRTLGFLIVYAGN